MKESLLYPYLGKVGIAVSAGLLASLMEERATRAAPADMLQSVSQRAVE